VVKVDVKIKDIGEEKSHGSEGRSSFIVVFCNLKVVFIGII
jgi:hypothetical protein